MGRDSAVGVGPLLRSCSLLEPRPRLRVRSTTSQRTGLARPRWSGGPNTHLWWRPLLSPPLPGGADGETKLASGQGTCGP